MQDHAWEGTAITPTFSSAATAMGRTTSLYRFTLAAKIPCPVHRSIVSRASDQGHPRGRALAASRGEELANPPPPSPADDDGGALRRRRDVVPAAATATAAAAAVDLVALLEDRGLAQGVYQRVVVLQVEDEHRVVAREERAKLLPFLFLVPSRAHDDV